MLKPQKLEVPQNRNAIRSKKRPESAEMLEFKKTDAYIKLHNRCCETIASVNKVNFPKNGVKICIPVCFNEIGEKIKLFDAVCDEFERAGWVVKSHYTGTDFRGIEFLDKLADKGEIQ